MLKHVETANMYISSINTQSIYKQQSLKKQQLCTCGQWAETTMCEWVRHVWGFATTLGLRESSPSISPTTHSLQLPLSAPWDTGASRSSSGANICASECSKLRRARSQTWHPSTWNILEHLGTSDPGVLRSPGVEPCLKVSAQWINVSSAGAIGCCRMLMFLAKEPHFCGHHRWALPPNPAEAAEPPVAGVIELGPYTCWATTDR
jgi:hypothetical protein